MCAAHQRIIKIKFQKSCRKKKTNRNENTLQGAPNDGFLLKALKTLFRLSRVLSALQKNFKHSKRCYKICVCSVVLGQLESFRNYNGLRIIFPKILDAILSFTKVRIFLIPLSIACLGPKILGFLFQRNRSKLDHHVPLREIRGRGRRDMPGSLCKGSFKIGCEQAFGRAGNQEEGKAKRPVDKHLGPSFHCTGCASDPDASSYWREH